MTQHVAALAETMRMDAPGKRPEKVVVGVGRCGVIACGNGCLAACQHCCDTRWIGGLYRLPHERSGSGGPVRCPDCEFQEDLDDPQRQRKLTLAAAGFYDGRDPIGTFETYDVNRQSGKGRDECRMAVNVVQAWVRREGPRLAVLVGGTGVGKTHLAEAATEYLALTRRSQVILATGEEFAYMLGRYLSTDEAKRKAYEDRLRHVDWLVFDEVGVAHGRGGASNEFVSSLYREIIGWRFAQGLPTLVTGNIPSDAMLKTILGDRIFDRLHDTTASRLITMWEAKSLRKERK